ncbi:unnamed protein product [Rhizoctonia solani]|uniref:Sodium/calcium exchanger membrane region domain-containing protein n=1 Tax=Rhizoctonia solani TaxID=456999 RepID=A0A8H3A5Q8_9AGAM|nr:unnamed protein product [Rhizoctonia solani]
MVILPVFALIAQAFLWTNSRYADVKTVHSLATVSAVSNVTILEDYCEPLSFPPVEQCTHVRTECDPSETFLSISYLENYFCSPLGVRPLAFGGLVLWLFFLFSFIGICASDFFCPNLATIASTLGLNENVAGVTFLAFGNGSPDLFSTFSAMRAGSGSLAIGELLGAASFIVSVVAGSMPLVRPFRVNPGSFVRDVGFFTVSVACILVILIDGEIHAWEALAMVGLYLVYVCVVVGGSWIENRRRRWADHETLIRGEYADTSINPAEQTPFEPYRDEDYSPLPTPSVRTRAHSNPVAPSVQDTLGIPSSRTRARPPLHIPHESDSRVSSASASPLTSSRSTSHVHQLPSFSLLGALEFRTVVNSLHGSSTAGTLNMFDAPVSPYAAGHYRRLSVVSSASSASSMRRGATTAPPAMEGTDPEEQRDPWDVAFSLQLSERGGGSTNNGTTLAPAAEIHRAKSPVPSIHIFSPNSPSNGVGPAAPRKLFVPDDALAEPQWKLVMRQVMHTLFPSLVDLSSRPWLWKLVAVCSAPAIFALTLTLPVVVSEPESNSGGGAGGSVTPLLIDYDESDVEDEMMQARMEAEEHVHDVHFNKWLTAIQCALSPVFCISVLFSGQKHVVWYTLAASLCGVSVATLTAVFANDGKNPAARLARCFIGFGVAMVWIMAIADEVVQVLQASVHLGASRW